MIVTRAVEGITSVHSGDGQVDATLTGPAEYDRRTREHQRHELLTRWLPPANILLHKLPPTKLQLSRTSAPGR